VNWFQRGIVMLAVLLIPVNKPDAEVARLLAALPTCNMSSIVVDHQGAIEEIRHAYAWNDLLRQRDSRLAAIDHQYFTPEQIMEMIDNWTPQIICIAGEFDIPPELLAGIMALEIDLDYHFTDAIFDNLVVSPLGRTFRYVEVGAGYAGVHFGHVKPALAVIGEDFSPAPFYRAYYRLTLTRSAGELTDLATRYQVIDIADAAVMARYYAQLRMGKQSLKSMTLQDMAFVWAAYRGGVVATPADPSEKSRWLLRNFKQANNVRVLGDTILAMPYFAHYREVYSGIVPDSAAAKRWIFVIQ
jgi:hypothetical protein